MAGRFLKVAVIYFLIGTVWGVVMGSSQHFEYTSAHAHINLLGWVSLGLIGVIFKSFPEIGSGTLATAQFWLHNIGLPLLVVSMVFFARGEESLGIPFAASGGLLIISSVIVFAVNIFKRIKN